MKKSLKKKKEKRDATFSHVLCIISQYILCRIHPDKTPKNIDRVSLNTLGINNNF